MRTQVMYVDVRTPEEFAERHYPGAKNVPLAVLDRRMHELEPKHRPLVIYCRSGVRSAHATSMLRRAGFTDVTDAGALDALLASSAHP